ncbi:MAG: PIN domain-containing protein [Deltaproteobacteria bacterium]|nr:PIN domain-containing protein [Deltaproteobacteria bacterium]
MKRIFLDTNILLDVLLARDPFCQRAQTVWSLAEKKEIVAAISTVSVSNVFFIIKKLSSREKAYEAVSVLAEIFKLVEVGAQTVSKSLQARFPDFEDAVQYYSALKFRAKAILSRDPSGFRGGKIPVMSCSEYLALLGG